MKMRSLLAVLAIVFLACSIRPAVSRSAENATTQATVQAGTVPPHPGTLITEPGGLDKAAEKGAAADHGEAARTPELPNFISILLDTRIDGKKIRSTDFG